MKLTENIGVNAMPPKARPEQRLASVFHPNLPSDVSLEDNDEFLSLSAKARDGSSRDTCNLPALRCA